MSNVNKVKRNNRRARKKGKLGNLSVDGLTLEHLDPLCLKGNTTQSNCVPCCEPCNGEKGGEDLLAYIDRVEMEQWREDIIHYIKNIPDNKFTFAVTAEEYKEYCEEQREEIAL